MGYHDPFREFEPIPRDSFYALHVANPHNGYV